MIKYFVECLQYACTNIEKPLIYISMNVTCQLLGGLGNMLFGMAVTHAVAMDNNLTPVLHLNHKGALHTHPKDYVNNIFRNFKTVDNVDGYHLYNEPTFTYTPISIPTDKNIKLYGYFQCEKYIEKYRSDILNIYSPTEEIKSYIISKYNVVKTNKCVSLHVRRGNYLNYPDIHPTVTKEYCDVATTMFPDYNFLVFSDDINFCKQILVGDKYLFVENEKDIVDLYLMSMCEHNIIANSSFSWWGAWLNTNGGNVIYPKKWFTGDMYTSVDICPERWIGL